MSDHVNFPEILGALSAPIPKELVRQRVGWTDRSGIGHEVDYIEWHTAADLLDKVYPAWTYSVKEIRQIGDICVVTASITIAGVTREGVGTGSALDEKGIKTAEHDALKRAAVKFGVARELYKKDKFEDDNVSHIHRAHPSPNNPTNNPTKSEPATDRQLAAIRAIAIVRQTAPEELAGKPLGLLSKREASGVIERLKSLPAQTQPEDVVPF